LRESLVQNQARVFSWEIATPWFLQITDGFLIGQLAIGRK